MTYCQRSQGTAEPEQDEPFFVLASILGVPAVIPLEAERGHSTLV
jgi:hypothetical protein